MHSRTYLWVGVAYLSCCTAQVPCCAAHVPCCTVHVLGRRGSASCGDAALVACRYIGGVLHVRGVYIAESFREALGVIKRDGGPLRCLAASYVTRVLAAAYFLTRTLGFVMVGKIKEEALCAVLPCLLLHARFEIYQDSFCGDAGNTCAGQACDVSIV